MASLWNLGGLTWGELGKRLWTELSEDSILARAAQLSFYFLLSIFPLLLIVMLGVGNLVGEKSALRSSLVKYLGTVAPDSASALVESILAQTSQGIGAGSVSFALLFFMWAASSGMVAVINALNDAYEVKETRPWWKTRLLAIGLTVALIVLIGGTLILITYGPQIAGAAAAYLGFGSVFATVWQILQWPLLILLVLLAFNLLYLYAPNLKHWDWHWLMPGTVVGVALWLVASYGFNFYVSRFGTYSLTYGSLGTAVVLLLWFYITGIAILIGAQINSEIEIASDKIGDAERKDDKQGLNGD